MKGPIRWVLLTVAAVGIGLACQQSDEIFEISVEGDTIQFVLRPDSIIENVDTILNGGDTIYVLSVDTFYQPPDTVVIQRFDTTIVGADTIVTTVFDTIVQIDTLIFQTTDTIIRYDTVYVRDTVVVPSPTLNLSTTSLSVDVGKSKTVVVSMKNHLGQTVPAGTITWVSANPAIASVLGSSTATISGISPGTVGIHAFTGNGISATLPVTVNDTATVPTGPTGPTPSGQFRRNLPAGWTTVIDYGFDDATPTFTNGQFKTGSLGSSGWDVLFWGTSGGAPRRTTDTSAPMSPSYVLEEVYPPGLSGSGTSAVYRSIPSSDKLYISWVGKWQTGFQHNNTSEKQIYFNPDASNYFIFQFHWGAESIYNIRDDSGNSWIEANQLPKRSDGVHNAPPLDGVWVEYEFLFDRASGTVRWWRNGELRASWTGRSFPTLNHLKLDTTWGGGGNKSGTHSRYTDHIFVARGS